jgi:hypothetical protein
VNCGSLFRPHAVGDLLEGELLSKEGRSKGNAVNQYCDPSDRRGRAFVVDQSLYPDGIEHPDDLERGGSRGGYRVGFAGDGIVGRR